jgi:hypothetical protein
MTVATEILDFVTELKTKGCTPDEVVSALNCYANVTMLSRDKRDRREVDRERQRRHRLEKQQTSESGTPIYMSRDKNAEIVTVSPLNGSPSSSPPHPPNNYPSLNPPSDDDLRARDEIHRSFEIWNDLAAQTGLPVAKMLSKTRASRLKARLRDVGGSDGWLAAMEKIRGSPFLLGQRDKFRATLDWILKETNFAKIMEGNYDDKPGNNQPRRYEKPDNGFTTLLREMAEERAAGLG